MTDPIISDANDHFMRTAHYNVTIDNR
jgi:hypothetical protein